MLIKFSFCHLPMFLIEATYYNLSSTLLYHRNDWNPLLFLCEILFLFCTYNLILNMIDKVIRKIRKNISIMNREVNVRNNKAHKEECNSILNSIICRYNEKVELRKMYYTSRSIKSNKTHIEFQLIQIL